MQSLAMLKPKILILIFVLILIMPRFSWAHEGHDEGTPSAGEVVGGVITLSPEAKENIGLKVVETEERPIDEVVNCIGLVATDPNKTAHLSSRISGRVLELFANPGDEVQKDQELVKIESRQIGNPPPTVTLKSPIAGTVIHRDMELGETVEPDKHLFEIADLKDLLVECNIYEQDTPKVKVGQKTRVKLPIAYPNELFEGEVSFFSATLDLETRTSHVWIRVPNQEKRLRPGMQAQASIIIKEKTRAVAVPREALMEEGGEKFVYLEESKDAFTRKSVVLGVSNDKDVEIKKGLIPGDRVVTSGNYELRMTELTAIKKEAKGTKKAK
jgi:multidrug efflux pump subunit AcrA (membrane-fusion protein)